MLNISDEGFECLCSRIVPPGTAVGLFLEARAKFQAVVVGQEGEYLMANFSRALMSQNVRDRGRLPWLKVGAESRKTD
jgi:hypothetical protein